MNSKLLTRAAALALCAALLTGCGTSGSESSSAASSSASSADISLPAASSEGTPARQPAVFTPTEEQLDWLIGHWIGQGWTPEGEERRCGLYFLQDDELNVALQDGIGNLLELSRGTWTLTDEEHFTLTMIPSLIDGEIPAKADAVQRTGTYFFSIGEDESMTISCLEGAVPLLPNHEYEPVSFYPEAVFMQNQDLGGPSEDELLMCTAAQDYYESLFDYRPTISEVVSKGPEGWTIHLYDDMGDHTATCAWYVISPVTFVGWDDMTGETVDLSFCLN